MALVWFELSTGQHPFAADSTIGMMHAIFSAHPIAPPTLNPEIPRAIDTLLLRMLNKDAASRPTSVEINNELSALPSDGALAYSSPSKDLRAFESTVGRDRELSALREAYRMVVRGG